MKPRLYDSVMEVGGRMNINQVRKELLFHAKGHVLEIGSGTGINFPLYKQAAKLTAIEPDRAMRRRSLGRKARATMPITIMGAKAESLPFDNGTFDTVVSTLVFCTVQDPSKSIEEVIRVAKTGATILFLEHVIVKRPFFAKLQHLMTPLWRRVAG